MLGAVLRGVDLTETIFEGVSLRGVDLRGASLLRHVSTVPRSTGAPRQGDFFEPASWRRPGRGRSSPAPTSRRRTSRRPTSRRHVHGRLPRRRRPHLGGADGRRSHAHQGADRKVAGADLRGPSCFSPTSPASISASASSRAPRSPRPCWCPRRPRRSSSPTASSNAPRSTTPTSSAPCSVVSRPPARAARCEAHPGVARRRIVMPFADARGPRSTAPTSRMRSSIRGSSTERPSARPTSRGEPAGRAAVSGRSLGVDAGQADFTSADLSSANLDHAVLVDATFERANLHKTRLPTPRARGRRCAGEEDGRGEDQGGAVSTPSSCRGERWRPRRRGRARCARRPIGSTAAAKVRPLRVVRTSTGASAVGGGRRDRRARSERRHHRALRRRHRRSAHRVAARRPHVRRRRQVRLVAGTDVELAAPGTIATTRARERAHRRGHLNAERIAVRASELSTVVGKWELRAQRLVEQVVDAYRDVDGLLQTRAGRCAPSSKGPIDCSRSGPTSSRARQRHRRKASAARMMPELQDGRHVQWACPTCARSLAPPAPPIPLPFPTSVRLPMALQTSPKVKIMNMDAVVLNSQIR